MLGATVVSGIGSLVVLLLVAPALGPGEYAHFSVYWSALFLVVSVLFGIQQETTRAVSATDMNFSARATSVMRFSMVVAGIVLSVALATGPFWSATLFSAANAVWVYPLSLSIAAYAMIAALNGVLGGRGNWELFALIPIIDSVLRLILVVAVLSLKLDTTWLAWAVAIPFPVSLVVVWLMSFGVIKRHTWVSISNGQLVTNTSRTMLASVSSALLINGFPILLAVFGSSDDAALGTLILAVMLTRAPILLPLTALQSMLIARFASTARAARGLLFRVILALGTAVILAAVAAGFWGPQLLEFFFGAEFVMPENLLFGLVIAAGSLGILTVTGAFALAKKRHNLFLLGWSVAAFSTILLLIVIPGELAFRTIIALSIGPMIGALVHLTSLSAIHPINSGGGVHSTEAANTGSLSNTAEVSVALCTHNGEQFIREQILSILRQSQPVSEIVLSDDASTDRTVSIAEELVEAFDRSHGWSPNLVILRNALPLGVTKNFEQAIRNCSSELIALSDQDDIWDPNRIQKLTERFNDAAVLFVFSDARQIDENGDYLGHNLFEALSMSKRERRMVESGRAYEQFLRRNLATGATVLFRRTLFEKADPFPEFWWHDEWLALVAAAYGGVRIDSRALTSYRQHSNNQIGMTKIGFRRKLKMLIAPRSVRSLRLFNRAEALSRRIDDIDGVSDEFRTMAHSKFEFELIRQSYSTRRLKRLFPILGQLVRGNYRRYGTGTKDAVRNLLQPI